MRVSILCESEIKKLIDQKAAGNREFNPLLQNEGEVRTALLKTATDLMTYGEQLKQGVGLQLDIEHQKLVNMILPKIANRLGKLIKQGGYDQLFKTSETALVSNTDELLTALRNLNNPNVQNRAALLKTIDRLNREITDILRYLDNAPALQEKEE